MDSEIVASFDATRDLSRKAFRSGCYAPFTSLYFSAQGDVRVCCHNESHPVGNVRQNSIREIWGSESLRELRSAIRRYDFSLGCEFCAWQVNTRQFIRVPITRWDRFTVSSETPEWPQMMEFSMNNTCNLECIMCDGRFSSAIRAHREKLPALPRCYSDAFFAELRSYLPHLQIAKFLGGEPFLQAECFRIWDMLIEDCINLPITVTTNGTQFNARVERILEKLPVGIAVSVDGFRKETVESIRVNANYDLLIENVMRFRAYAKAKKTTFGLTYCLMRRNWQEFADFCVFAEELDCSVWVNVVRRPAELSLYTLHLDDLDQIVAAMEQQASMLEFRMGRNYPIWENEINRLRTRCSGAEVPGLTAIQGVAGR